MRKTAVLQNFAANRLHHIRTAFVFSSLFLLLSCGREIAQTKFSASDVEVIVTFKKIEHHEDDDWVFANVRAKFHNRRSLLEIRCLRLSSGKNISNRVYVDSYIGGFPTITADSNRSGSRDFYWIVNKGMQDSDLKNVTFSFIKEDPGRRTIDAKCD